MPEYNCYIDESGDEGIGTGGSRWFVLGAVIVPAEYDLQWSAIIPAMKRRLGKDERKYILHWSYLDHKQKRFVAQTLGALDFTLSVVVVDKEDPFIEGSSFLKTKDVLYRYTARYLIERLSWLARDRGRIAKLTFEYRSNLDYDGMRAYWQHLRFLIPSTQIHWPAIDWKNFRILPKRQNRWLQATDACCGAVYNALERDQFGNVEEVYVMELRERFYRRGGKLFSYGLKFMPTAARGRACREFDWLQKI